MSLGQAPITSRAGRSRCGVWLVVLLPVVVLLALVVRHSAEDAGASAEIVCAMIAFVAVVVVVQPRRAETGRAPPLARRDLTIVAVNVRRMLRRGPAGVVRLSRNAWRIVVGSWEQPPTAERWQEMLALRQFSAIRVELLDHEGGIAFARRPDLKRNRHAAPRLFAARR